MAGELDRGGDTFLDHPYANTFKALQAATAALDPGLAFAYTSLAVYPPDTRVPVAAVSRYWGRLRGVSPGQVRAELRMLADRELLILDRDEIAFHDLQHSYLLLQADDLALLHDGLLAGYRALLAPAGAGWWRLPAGEPYIWDHLLYHLLGAGDRSGAASTVTDLAYPGQADRAGRAARRGDRPCSGSRGAPRRPADRLAAALAGPARPRARGSGRSG